ncbi:MAG: nucleotidyltransferase domain-containing protein [Thermocrispum sp.]
MTGSAGVMIRQARRRAQLSQTDLARRAGVAQSVISAYESDKREPGMRTLARLIRTTGHEMAIELIPLPRVATGLPHTTLGRRLRRHRRAVIAAADQRGAHNVRVFGSVARGKEGPASDIDLLVDLDDGVGLVAMAGLRQELGELLRVAVDVVPAATVKPAMRRAILDEAIPL